MLYIYIFFLAVTKRKIIIETRNIHQIFILVFFRRGKIFKIFQHFSRFKQLFEIVKVFRFYVDNITSVIIHFIITHSINKNELFIVITYVPITNENIINHSNISRELSRIMLCFIYYYTDKKKLYFLYREHRKHWTQFVYSKRIINTNSYII